MTKFPQLLFKSLRQMDAEAVTLRNGCATGLNWYGAHREPQKSRPRNEVCWSERLAELLPASGFPTGLEVPYPYRRRWKCDNVITLEDGKRLWMENKGAWKEYWLKRKNERIYRSYLLHPLVKGLEAHRTHTAALDLEKLRPLQRPEADYVGLLLVGFDSNAAPMNPDVAELADLAKLNDVPWREAHDSWPDPRRTGSNVRCWFWWRPV